MVLEYLENGQVMNCDLETMTFYSPMSSKSFKIWLIVDKVLDESTAQRYMIDIITGLKYCNAIEWIKVIRSAFAQGCSS